MNIDQLMGFDPSRLNVFQEKTSVGDPNVYKTNPKNSKSDDGVYRSAVRLLLNLNDPSKSIINQQTYYLKSHDGNRLVKSALADGDKNCPIFKAWKRIWFSKQEGQPGFAEARNRAKLLFDRNQSMWTMVQVIEDDNNPEAVGKFKFMKLPKAIYDMVSLAMSPGDSKTKPYPVMDPLIGLTVNIVVTPGPDDNMHPERKMREIKYTSSSLGDFQPIIKTDGTNLLTDEELELVDTYVTALKDASSGKTAAKKAAGEKKVQEIHPQLKPLYEKIIKYTNDYAKDEHGESMDLVKSCAYQPWDESTSTFVSHWIEMVDAGVDPVSMSYQSFRQSQVTSEVSSTVITDVSPEPLQSESDEGLPF